MIAIFLTLIVLVVLWTLNHMATGQSLAALFELMVLVLAHGVVADIVFKTWERLDWPPRRQILLYGVVSAAAAAAVLFLPLPRSATWYEFAVVATFFAHGALTALSAHCYYDGCEES
jgi:hypothetical protein